MAKADGQNSLFSWNDVGARIKRRRTELGLGQKDLGARSGVTQAAIAQVESGRRGLSVESSVLLAEALGLSLDELLRGRAPGDPELDLGLGDRYLLKKFKDFLVWSARRSGAGDV